MYFAVSLFVIEFRSSSLVVLYHHLRSISSMIAYMSQLVCTHGQSFCRHHPNAHRFRSPPGEALVVRHTHAGTGPYASQHGAGVPWSTCAL